MWDQRFDRDDYLYGTEPSQFLVAQRDRLRPGQRALVVAEGEGRNAVYLAEQGLEVRALDSSRVALAKAQRLAAERRVEVDFRYTDLAHWQWEPDAYDLVVAIFIQFADPALRAAIFAGMQQTLAPGGLLLLHGFTPAQLAYGTGGPPCAELLYTPELLREAFAEMEILQLEEYERELQEGSGHAGQAALIDLVARLPVAAEPKGPG
ncbi:SAM-dependent methyltransferase [Lamprobacter modestohalophilus]|uniref:SAM-dependent methyltransferase n=1 Tax=Lamprobacter modestohalophilus TaxID=1064514 RepID=A0A9X0W544_9GAMM|nr:class I SAM-dependent methyltransferase [Lamprobacter modestohalophilus]MBK1616956.1 SAM-dependent methyltransferase [Lamprobacter modestohalophilus]